MSHAPLRVAAMTGGHSFDVPAFQDAFEHPELRCYHQSLDDWAIAGADTRRAYDVAVFYHMLMDGPLESGAWYQGNHRAAFEELGGGQGVVVLHHALLSYPHWDVWTELTGLADRSFTFDHDQTITVNIADPGHPVTRGLDDWTMVDETYGMASPEHGDNRVLLTVDHPLSMKVVGWTREYRGSRVFCYQCGHDGQTFADASFREVLTRGIRWAAGRLG
ncbi:MAG: ThuA domain-containing protein [Armatimonadetes bacterium]|nr:ThuA domain-containing protein [Armatimonadota bacterium]